MVCIWDVIEVLVKEVGVLFLFGYLYLGCDELFFDIWMGSFKVCVLMVEYDLDIIDDL